MHDHDKKSGGCTACSCPCDTHKTHTHGEDHDEKKEGETCLACSCSGDDHRKHTCS